MSYLKLSFCPNVNGFHELRYSIPHCYRIKKILPYGREPNKDGRLLAVIHKPLIVFTVTVFLLPGLRDTTSGPLSMDIPVLTRTDAYWRLFINHSLYSILRFPFFLVQTTSGTLSLDISVLLPLWCLVVWGTHHLI